MTVRYKRLREAISVVTRARLQRANAVIPSKDLEVVSIALKAMERYLEGLGEHAQNPGDPVDLLSPQDLYDREEDQYIRVTPETPMWIPTRINRDWSEWRVHTGDVKPLPNDTSIRWIPKNTTLTSDHTTPEEAITHSSSTRVRSLNWSQQGSGSDVLYYCILGG